MIVVAVHGLLGYEDTLKSPMCPDGLTGAVLAGRARSKCAGGQSTKTDPVVL